MSFHPAEEWWKAAYFVLTCIIAFVVRFWFVLVFLVYTWVCIVPSSSVLVNKTSRTGSWLLCSCSLASLMQLVELLLIVWSMLLIMLVSTSAVPHFDVVVACYHSTFVDTICPEIWIQLSRIDRVGGQCCLRQRETAAQITENCRCPWPETWNSMKPST